MNKRIIVQVNDEYVNVFTEDDVEFITVDKNGKLIEPEEGTALSFVGTPQNGNLGDSKDFDRAWDRYMADIENAQNPDPEDLKVEDEIDRLEEEDALEWLDEMERDVEERRR